MKRPLIQTTIVLIILSLILPGCNAKPLTCDDPLGCIPVGSQQPVRLAALLTLNGPESPYGIDALRGVEIAVAKQKEVAGHAIELVKVDDMCSEEGGTSGAQQIAADTSIVGVIGTACSSASVPAAKILSRAGAVMISPASTAPSLTAPGEYQPGFFRTIYNDKAQGRAVADFAYRVLGLRTMTALHDGAAYSEELTAAACEDFESFGGKCLGRIEIPTGQDLSDTMAWVASLDADALYYPVYTVDGVNITQEAAKRQLRSALISSDGLLSSDFIEKAGEASQGMYLSGPAPVPESAPFVEQYRNLYGEDPVASYHLQAYDAAEMLFGAIEKAARSSRDGSLLIGKQALRDAILGVHGMTGLSGPLTCSELGDCAQPNIEIFQVQKNEFQAIYP